MSRVQAVLVLLLFWQQIIYIKFSYSEKIEKMLMNDLVILHLLDKSQNNKKVIKAITKKPIHDWAVIIYLLADPMERTQLIFFTKRATIQAIAMELFHSCFYFFLLFDLVYGPSTYLVCV